MRIVWVLTVLRLVAGGSRPDANSMQPVQAHAPAPPSVPYERLTIGHYETKAACMRMLEQVMNAPGFKAGSAQCRKELN